MTQNTTCSFEGCGRKLYGKVWCQAHSDQMRRRGWVGPLNIGSHQERFWRKVEKTETCWNWTGATAPGGYGHLRIDKVDRRAHRVSWEWANGPIPEDMMIDHVCHNKACVNPSHLRLATHKQNQEYRSGANSPNQSGIRGVSWSSTANKWRARVMDNSREHYLGVFPSREEAEAAVKAKRAELFTFPEN